jgi:hypothetical protein
MSLAFIVAILCSRPVWPKAGLALGAFDITRPLERAGDEERVYSARE